MEVQLGVAGAYVPRSKAGDDIFYSSRIGGAPIWMGGVPPPTAMCADCGKAMLSIAHIYTPDVFARALDVLVCPCEGCNSQNTPHIYRIVSIAPTTSPPPTTTSCTILHGAHPTPTDSDSATKQKLDDWGGLGGGWSSDDDDEEATKPAVSTTEDTSPVENTVLLDLLSLAESKAAPELDTQTTHTEKPSADTAVPSTGKATAKGRGKKGKKKKKGKKAKKAQKRDKVKVAESSAISFTATVTENHKTESAKGKGKRGRRRRGQRRLSQGKESAQWLRPWYVVWECEPEDVPVDFSKEDAMYREYQLAEEAVKGVPDPQGDQWEEEYEETGDVCFEKFHERLNRRPQQCLRYCRGGEALRLQKTELPLPPVCGACGAQRQFEMQFLPNLLFHIGQDKGTAQLGSSLEWGTIDVYTCTNKECSVGNYVEEFCSLQATV